MSIFHRSDKVGLGVEILSQRSERSGFWDSNVGFSQGGGERKDLGFGSLDFLTEKGE